MDLAVAAVDDDDDVPVFVGVTTTAIEFVGNSNIISVEMILFLLRSARIITTGTSTGKVPVVVLNCIAAYLV